jgi:hypothetical protein
MGIARNLARVIADNSGAIAAGNLGNAIPADGSITTDKLANDAITTAKLAASAVTSAKIADGAVVEADIANLAISSGKLASTLDLSAKTLTLPSSSVKEYQVVEAARTDNLQLNGDSGWVQYMSASFTTTQTCTVLCHAGFAHGFEEGVVVLHGRFRLASSGATTSELQVFKQGFSSNFSFGAHSLHGFLINVGAGSHTVHMDIRNYAGGTFARMNYFDNNNAGDRMFILFK